MNYISQLYIICVFVRIGFMYLAYLSIQYNKYYKTFSGFYAVLGIGSIYHWIYKYRKKGGFNQSIWWDYLRPVHAIIYLYVSYLIYKKNMAFIPLLVADNLIGLTGHVFYHYYSIH